MTKNDAQAKQTIRIFSADGEQIGTTYPKRAKGLVAKGRARYVNGSDICLIVSEVTDITEEPKMDNNITTNATAAQATEIVNKLYFSAREWHFNPDCEDNVGNRSFMQGPDGIINEAFMIGDWSWNWTEIVSGQLTLPKDTLHTFTFWLNGGENDRNNEVCRFEVVFNNDYENRYTYNLNRNFIKPLKKVNGWELYEIPFRTGNNEYTQLRFVAQGAYMTVLAAKDVPEYAELPDTTDPYEEYRPQRHNIVFNDGWPNNTWYSTQRLEATHSPSKAAAQAPQNTADMIVQESRDTSSIDEITDAIEDIQSSINDLHEFDLTELREQLKNALAGNQFLSADDIQEIIENAMTDAESSIIIALNELNSSLEELNNTLDEMQG